ncbi:hypothetical protein [Bacteroides congonensis]|uniref:hypothetical protein n=1 Tax=Bacteroides congonensis TaxID=1871006 RepID=UPI000933297F|nr:hypothetical protein [Bacteroides congonensis]
MKSTFKVLFYLKKGSEKKNGEVMIMARITIDGKLWLSLKIWGIWLKYLLLHHENSFSIHSFN